MLFHSLLVEGVQHFKKQLAYGLENKNKICFAHKIRDITAVKSDIPLQKMELDIRLDYQIGNIFREVVYQSYKCNFDSSVFCS